MSDLKVLKLVPKAQAEAQAAAAREKAGCSGEEARNVDYFAAGAAACSETHSTASKLNRSQHLFRSATSVEPVTQPQREPKPRSR